LAKPAQPTAHSNCGQPWRARNSVPIRGYGARVYGAISAAQGRIDMGDSDDSYNFENLAHSSISAQGYDCMETASRRDSPRDAGKIATSEIHFSLSEKFLFRAEWDSIASPRASPDAFQQMDLRTTGMEFASEM